MAALYQVDEVFRLVYAVTGHGLQVKSVAAGSGVTSTFNPINAVLSAALNVGAGELQVSTVAPSGNGPGTIRYQPGEVLRGVFDPSVSALRVAVVSTGGGPNGKRYQVNVVLSGAYDPVVNALRVVSVSAGSGPNGKLYQPNEFLSACYDPVAGALQVVGGL